MNGEKKENGEENRYLYFVHLNSATKKVFENSYRREEFQKVVLSSMPNNVLILKKGSSFDDLVKDKEVLGFVLNFLFRHFVDELVFIDFSEIINEILNEISDFLLGKYMMFHGMITWKLRQMVTGVIADKV